MNKIVNCPRCQRELEVNNENYILGEEPIIVGRYSIWIDAHVTEDYDFVCRRCVLDLANDAVMAEWERINERD